MEILRNQTLYKCSYCGKKLLSKKGADIHEYCYCSNENSLNKKNIQAKAKWYVEREIARRKQK